MIQLNMTSAGGNRNTRLALLALALFIVFDIAGVSLNTLLSWRLEQQAIGINLAGRQRMLSQRMVKVLLQIDHARLNNEPTKAYFEELKLTFDLFDNTLQGFDTGHDTKGGAGEPLFLQPVTEPGARKAVTEAVALWQEYRSKVAVLITQGESSNKEHLQAALIEARSRNLKLLSLMNSLTTELERMTQQEAQRIRIYQVVVLALAMLCFAWAFVLFRRGEAESLLARQQAADAARAEQNYVTDLVAQTTIQLQLAEDLAGLASQLFTTLTPTLDIGAASLYRFNAADRMLVACGQYAGDRELSLIREIPADEGLIGECVQAGQMRLINNPAEGFGTARTALLQVRPAAIVLLPVTGNGQLFGLIEMALLKPLNSRHEEVLKGLLPILALRLEMMSRISQTAKNKQSKTNPSPASP